MNKEKSNLIVIVLWAIFGLPSTLYFVVNGYWWLFDGNQPIASKMSVAAIVSLITTFTAVMNMWIRFDS
jgi:hypothetical protein